MSIGEKVFRFVLFVIASVVVVGVIVSLFVK